MGGWIYSAVYWKAIRILNRREKEPIHSHRPVRGRLDKEPKVGKSLAWPKIKTRVRPPGCSSLRPPPPPRGIGVSQSAPKRPRRRSPPDPPRSRSAGLPPAAAGTPGSAKEVKDNQRHGAQAPWRCWTPLRIHHWGRSRPTNYTLPPGTCLRTSLREQGERTTS